MNSQQVDGGSPAVLRLSIWGDSSTSHKNDKYSAVDVVVADTYQVSYLSAVHQESIQTLSPSVLAKILYPALTAAAVTKLGAVVNMTLRA